LAITCIECGRIIEGAREGGRGRPKLRHESCANLAYAKYAFEKAVRARIEDGMGSREASQIRGDITRISNEISAVAMKGASNPAAKLTIDRARACLVDFASGEWTVQALATRERVGASTIRRLVKGQSWVEIPRTSASLLV
jgi:hypothetical protein